MNNPLAPWSFSLSTLLLEYALLTPITERDTKTFWENEAWLHRNRAESLERELEEFQAYASKLERLLAEG